MLKYLITALSSIPSSSDSNARIPNLAILKATLITCISKKISPKSDISIKSYSILTQKSQNFPLRDAGFPKNSKLSINSCFEKSFSGGSLCTRGAAGIWAVDLFSTTYFGEIIIFVVSKDQTFRIRCTLMNPEQFLILVPYLFLIFKFSKFNNSRKIKKIRLWNERMARFSKWLEMMRLWLSWILIILRRAIWVVLIINDQFELWREDCCPDLAFRYSYHRLVCLILLLKKVRLCNFLAFSRPLFSNGSTNNYHPIEGEILWTCWYLNRNHNPLIAWFRALFSTIWATLKITHKIKF